LREQCRIGRVEAEWVSWRQVVFGDPYLVWHDGPDFTGLIARCRANPAGVWATLQIGLAASDPLAAQSVTALAREGLTPAEAEAALRHALPAAEGAFRVRIAQALGVITDRQEWAEEILPVLAGAGPWGPRIDAATVLAEFTPTPQLVEALAAAVQDEEYLVRYHAADTLLIYSGRVGDVSRYPALFRKIMSPRDDVPDAGDRERWREAARELQRAATR
jgi:HEAT repeat protein